jgi:2-amino-4-hydroxy-6-hydroxymethyldihydropteridine diphosphokinase
MIFIGLGANLESEEFGPPVATVQTALSALETPKCVVRRCSNWYRSAPVPMSTQPWYINGVAELECEMSPEGLLDHLHTVEDRFGRVRSTPNAARVLDLDLLIYDDLILKGDPGPILPHPRMQKRAFVLLPLDELAPDWVDPRNGSTLGDLIDNLPGDQACLSLTEGNSSEF